jgi:hypothetical protein
MDSVNANGSTRISNIKQDFLFPSATPTTKTTECFKLNEYQSIYKSTDFNAKELDEKIDSISIRNLESNRLSFSNNNRKNIFNFNSNNDNESNNNDSSNDIETHNHNNIDNDNEFNISPIAHESENGNGITVNNTINNNLLSQFIPVNPLNQVTSVSSMNTMYDYSSIKNTIHLKNNFIANLNFFIQNYVNDIYNLFNKIDAIIYKKVTSILDKNKYFIRFFKEITTLYETFSINLLQANNTISLHFKDEDESSPYSQINNTVDKTQELISNSFYDFSKNLQNKIISKGPLSNLKIKEFYNKMSSIAKESSAIISEITKKRDKLVQKYLQNEKLFESFKKSFNDNEKLNAILNKNEFYVKEFEFCNTVNKLFDKIEQFFTKYKQSLSDLKSLTNSFLTSVKDTIDIYATESKKMFLIEEMDNVIDNLKIQIHNLYGEKDILMDYKCHKLLNDQLKIFQTNLIKFSFVKNDDIYIDNYFNIEKYNNYEELTDFLNSLIPNRFDIFNSNLLIFSCEAKKTSGLFKHTKPCVIAITLQGSVLIFDEKINKKLYEKLSLRNLKFKSTEEKNGPYKFELSELKLGMIYNSKVKVILEVESIENYEALENIFNTQLK